MAQSLSSEKQGQESKDRSGNDALIEAVVFQTIFRLPVIPSREVRSIGSLISMAAPRTTAHRNQVGATYLDW